jgi:hypothetical protein
MTTMRTHDRPLVLVLSLALGAAACGESAPDEPTWADVQPILMANCARCHGGLNPTGGAPTTFRLDVPYTQNGTQTIYGAAAMADFVVARACEEGDMPPVGPHLSGTQCDILEDWSRSHPDPAGSPIPWVPSNSCGEEGDPFHLCTRPDDHRPAAFLISPDPGAVPGTQLVTVFIDDADQDQVVGTLRWSAGEEGVIGQLHGGRNTLFWFARRVPVGTWSLTAQINDIDPAVNGTVDYDMGAFTVSAAPAPFVSFAADWADPADPMITSAPLRDQVIADSASPFQIRFHVIDSSPSTPANISAVAAIRSDERIEIRSAPQLVVPGQVLQTVIWDTTGVPAGEWRIEVTIDDGDQMTSDRYRSEPFWVFHGATTRTCGEVDAVLEKNCATCHDDDSAHPVVGGPLFTNCAEVATFPGKVYRRVIQKREMPPRSQGTLFGENPMTLEERAVLQEWIEGGGTP